MSWQCLKCESASRHFQPWEGPWSDLFHDCEIFANFRLKLQGRGRVCVLAIKINFRNITTATTLNGAGTNPLDLATAMQSLKKFSETCGIHHRIIAMVLYQNTKYILCAGCRDHLNADVCCISWHPGALPRCSQSITYFNSIKFVVADTLCT